MSDTTTQPTAEEIHRRAAEIGERHGRECGTAWPVLGNPGTVYSPADLHEETGNLLGRDDAGNEAIVDETTLLATYQQAVDLAVEAMAEPDVETPVVEYRIYTGSTCEDRATTKQDGLTKLAALRERYAQRLDVPVLLAVTLMPDGNARTTEPIPGGTWGGCCGSTIWVDPDSEGFLPALRQEAKYVRDRGVEQTQRAYAAGPEHPKYLHGYRLACEHPFRDHPHRCGAVVFPGTWFSWEPDLLADAERIA